MWQKITIEIQSIGSTKFMISWLGTTYIVFILPLKLNNSFIPTHLYSNMWYNICDSYTHRSTHKENIGNYSRITASLAYPLSSSKRTRKMVVMQISINFHYLFQIIKHPFQSPKSESDKFPVCFVFVCNNK